MAVTREKKGSTEAAPEPYDQLVDRLEKLVVELEEGRLPLESSLERFAEGVRLARDAGRRLDEAERKVEQLLRTEGGAVETAPLEGEDEGA